MKLDDIIYESTFIGVWHLYSMCIVFSSTIILFFILYTHILYYNGENSVIILTERLTIRI